MQWPSAPYLALGTAFAGRIAALRLGLEVLSVTKLPQTLHTAEGRALALGGGTFAGHGRSDHSEEKDGCEGLHLGE